MRDSALKVVAYMESPILFIGSFLLRRVNLHERQHPRIRHHRRIIIRVTTANEISSHAVHVYNFFISFIYLPQPFFIKAVHLISRFSKPMFTSARFQKYGPSIYIHQQSLG